MSTSTSLSGFSLTPGGDNTPAVPQGGPPTSSTPTPSVAGSTDTFYSQSVVPTVVPAGQFSAEQIHSLLYSMPQLLQQLSPDQQNQLLLFLSTSDIMNFLFNNLDDPTVQAAFNSIVQSLFQNGLLQNITQDTQMLPQAAQAAMSNAIQQNVTDTLTNPLGSGQTPSDTIALNIPVSQPGLPNLMPLSIATLVAESITQAMQQIVQSTNPAAQVEPQAQNMLTSLITLQLTSAPGGVVQIMIPAKMDAAGSQTGMSQLEQQLALLTKQLANLDETATSEKWHVGVGMQQFVTAPPAILAMLKSLQPDDVMTYNFLKTWVNNSDAIPTAMLNHAADTYRDKFEFLKTIVFSSLAAAPAALIEEEQMRRQVFDQVLLAAPALLNIFKLKDIVGGFEDNIKRKHAALLFKFKRMLYNSAHEITVVVKGIPTFEYNEVGVFHDLLPPLAERIVALLPPAAEQLSFELMELIANDITMTFTYIKEHEPHRINDLLKRHPRTLLYLLSTGSPITADMPFPTAQSLGPLPDTTLLTSHFARILNVVKKFEKQSEFLKCQPKVLEAFIEEAKYEPQSQVTKTSLDIIHKAIAECSGFIDLDTE